MKLGMNEVNANFWKRLIAFVIDSIVISIIVWPLQGIIKDLTQGFNTSDLFVAYNYITNPSFIKNIPGLTIVFLTTAVLTIAYWSILEYKTKQTIGKMLLKIQVKSEERQLTLGQCVIRSISKISGILLLIDCIGLLDRKGQRYSEKISKTRVIEKRFMI